MIATLCRRMARRFHGWLAGALLMTATWSSSAVLAQTGSTPVTVPAKLSLAEAAPPAKEKNATGDSGIVQTSCSTCSQGLLSALRPPPAAVEGVGIGGAGDCPCGNNCAGCAGCVPGRVHCCSCCDSNNCFVKMLCGFYECICCPDPCYDPHWTG